MKSPPLGVKRVISALTTLILGLHTPITFRNSKKIISDPHKFLRKMQSFDPNTIDNVTLKILERLPAKLSLVKIKSISQACYLLAEWIFHMIG